MSSTFGGLYIGKSGVQAARTALNITGQNITNANTDGYTRQRVDQSALSPAALNMLYAAAAGSYTGQGTGITGIEQLRDKFLDSEYRTQRAVTGSTSAQASALQDIQTALDESTTDGVSSAFSALIKQMEGLTSSGSSTTFTESTLKEAASLFASKLNIASGDIDTVWSQQYNYLTNFGTDKVNTLLKSIAGLSDTIKSAQISGQPALELLDERNSDIDELSQYVSVQVQEHQTDVGAGKSVDTLSLVLADSSGKALQDANGNPYRLVDGDQYASFSTTSDDTEESGAAKPTSDPYHVAHIKLNGLSKDGSNLEVDSGKISTDSHGNLTVVGDSYYDFTGASNVKITTAATDTIETLQSKFQSALTSAGITVGITSDKTQLTFTAADGSALSVQKHTGSANDVLVLNGASPSSTDTDKMNSLLQDGKLGGYLKLLNQNGEFDTTTDFRGIGYYRQMLDTVAQNFATVINKLNSTNDAGNNKPLFTNNLGATDVINAGNIRISSDWTAGYLTTTKNASNAGDKTGGSNTNITAMLTALNSTPYTLMAGSKKLFTGTVQESVSDISLTLGQDIQSIQSQDDTNSNMLDSIETHRQSLSSVDINEEAINLTVYNQALSAAARFTTTVDECLSTIINNMGVAGK